MDILCKFGQHRFSGSYVRASYGNSYTQIGIKSISENECSSTGCRKTYISTENSNSTVRTVLSLLVEELWQNERTGMWSVARFAWYDSVHEIAGKIGQVFSPVLPKYDVTRGADGEERCRHPEPTVDHIRHWWLTAMFTTRLRYFPVCLARGLRMMIIVAKSISWDAAPAWAGSFFTIKPDPLIPALRESPYLLCRRSPDK